MREYSIPVSELTGEAIEIQFIPLTFLAERLPDLLWDKNAKLHDLEQIYRSIEEHGFQDPPKFDQALNGGAGGFVYGNGRIESLVHGLVAAKNLGKKPPRGIKVSIDGEWAIPIKFGLDAGSEAEAQAFGIDHNNTTLGGSGLSLMQQAQIWDQQKYAAVLRDLSSQNILPVTVGAEDIATILINAANALGHEKGEAEDEDERDDLMNRAAEDDYECRVELGQIWRLGRHTVMIGDCTLVQNAGALRAAAGRKADACWTDPPYGVSSVGKTAEAMTIDNDQLADGDLREFLLAAFLNVKLLCEEGAPVYVAHPAGEISHIFYQAIVEAELVLKQTLVWVKNTFAMGRSDYHYQHEPIYYAYCPGSQKPSRMGNGGWYGGHNATSVFNVNKPSANRLHPTMKPVELIEMMLKNSVPPRGHVFEPFLGSGSTLIACEQMGLSCMGFELDPKYGSVVLDRWEELTGDEAELIEP